MRSRKKNQQIFRAISPSVCTDASEFQHHISWHSKHYYCTETRPYLLGWGQGCDWSRFIACHCYQKDVIFLPKADTMVSMSSVLTSGWGCDGVTLIILLKAHHVACARVEAVMEPLQWRCAYHFTQGSWCRLLCLRLILPLLPTRLHLLAQGWRLVSYVLASGWGCDEVFLHLIKKYYILSSSVSQ